MGDLKAELDMMWGSLRALVRWDAIAGLLGVGLAVAAVGQALRGNGSDEIWFSIYAALMFPVSCALLLRAARHIGHSLQGAQRNLAMGSGSFAFGLTVFAGTDGGSGLAYWAYWPIVYGSALVAFLGWRWIALREDRPAL